MVIEVWRDDTLIAEVVQRDGLDDEVVIYPKDDGGPVSLTLDEVRAAVHLVSSKLGGTLPSTSTKS